MANKALFLNARHQNDLLRRLHAVTALCGIGFG